MKSKLKFLLPIIALIIIAFAGCKEDDPCDSLLCQNGGFCISGYCDCPDGWTGAICTTPVTPSLMIIKEIILTDFPVTNAGGSWDQNSDYPDIYLSLELGTDPSNFIRLYNTIYYDECNSLGNYPYNNLNWSMDNADSYYTIALLDEDGNSDTYMRGLTFRPKDIGFDYNFPETITLEDGLGTKIIVTLAWVF